MNNEKLIFKGSDLKVIDTGKHIIIDICFSKMTLSYEAWEDLKKQLISLVDKIEK